MSFGAWDPNEWELFACGLLQDRHGAINLMKVPARHKGDLGIDYYCKAEGVVYQCYAVQEPCDVRDRADKQKAKITTDLRKFRRRQAELKALLGDTKIKRWILVAPLHDSREVNEHLTKKATEMRTCGLPYATADFEVLIHDVTDFDQGSVNARSMRQRLITIPSKPPTAREIDDWVEASSELVATLMGKLRKRTGPSDAQALQASVDEAIGWFLERENALESMRNSVPQLYEALVGVISRHAKRLTLYGHPATGDAHQVLRAEMESLITSLEEAIPNFSAESAHQIALGTIAEWLLRCPLDFPPYADA